MKQQQSRFIALAILLGWDFLLIGYRISLSGRGWFLFYVWNLFLAIIPFFAAQLAVYSSEKKYRLPVLFWALVSILFLPNAPYIITDLFHLHERAEMPLWFDTLTMFSMAVSGVIFFYLSLFDLQKIAMPWMHRWWVEFGALLICLLCGFGIYLGRYMRFNSWDVLSNPDDLFYGISGQLIHSGVRARPLGVTMLYGAFLFMGYWVIKLLNFRTFAPSHQGIHSSYAKNPDS